MRGFLSVLLLGFPALLLAVAAACSDRVPLPATLTPSESPVATTFTGQRTPVPSPTPGQTPVGTPAILAGLDVQPLRFGAEAQIPQGLALILEMGCWGCDGPTTGFIRVYRDTSGKVRVDQLLAMDAPWLPRRIFTTKEGTLAEDEPYVTGFAMAGDASDMVVSVCVKEWCGSGGMDAWSPGSVTKLLRSTDGGVTWAEMGELHMGGFVVDLSGDGRVLVGTWEQEGGPAVFRVFPELEPVQAPGPIGKVWPRFIHEGEVIWQDWDEGKLLRSDGSVFLELGPSGYAGRPFPIGPGASSYGLAWSSGGTAGAWLSIVMGGRFTTTFSTEFLLLAAAPAAGAIPPGMFVGNIGVREDQLQAPLPSGRFFLGILPALIDTNLGVVHAITDPFLREDWTGGRSIVQAVQAGTLLRVVNTGSCLNIRAGPDPAALVLDCMADGVLLRQGIGNGQYPGGVYDDGGWYSVITPAGAEGFASGAYLER